MAILNRYFVYGYRTYVLIAAFPLLIPLLFPWVLIWAKLYQAHAKFSSAALAIDGTTDAGGDGQGNEDEDEHE